MFCFQGERQVPGGHVGEKRYLTPAALAVLALAVCGPAVLADTTLTRNPDGTSTMTTTGDPGGTRITEFDCKGNITRITWLEAPDRKKIVEFNADGKVTSQTILQANAD